MVGNRLYGAGSFVVLMAQPYKPYAWALLEKQKYPDIRQYPGGPPQPPYDNAGWTLPLQMGVACEEIKEPFEAKLEKLDAVPYPKIPAGQGQAAYIALDSRVNASSSVVFALLKEAKAEAWRTKAKAVKKGVEIPTGSFLVKMTPEVKAALPALLAKHHLTGARSSRPGRPVQGRAQVPPRRALPVLARQRRRGLDPLHVRRPGHPLQDPAQRGHQGDQGKEGRLAGGLRRHRLRRREHDGHQVRPARRHAGRRRPAAPAPRAARPGPPLRRHRPSTRAASARRVSTPCGPSSRKAASSSL